jgi:hypothetical protein
MPKKKPKHPREMTTHEAMRHLFHPHVIEHVKKAAHQGGQARKPKGGSK